jgi:hypothetical protein
MRRPLTALVFLVLAALLGGSLVASAATANDTACRALIKTSDGVSGYEGLVYNGCRFDKLDAAVAKLQPTSTPSSSPSATPTATPSSTPTSVPTTASPSPSTTATPSPSSTAAGGFPSASSTGVPSGVTLSAYTGPSTITTASTVIDSKRITSCLDIKANNVTIKRSLISGNCFFNVLNDSGNTGLVLSDVEIDGGNARADGAAIGGRSYTCLRCDIHGTGDGVKLGDNVTVQDSWIHDLYGANDSHNDGMQASDGSNIRVLHNTITPVYRGSTSAIIIKADFGPISDLTFDGNLVGGGAWTVYAGAGYGSGIPDATGVKITNNQFTTAYFAKSGAFGPITNTGSGVTVAGNTWADGPSKGQPVT